MSNLPLILIAVLTILLITAVILVFIVRKQQKSGREMKTDYRALFVMGVIFTGVGVSLAASLDNAGMYGITAMGIIYMIVGITHRNEWQKK